MLIDRSLADIATTRIGDLEGTKSLEKGREEKYTNSDFFHELGIEIIHTHLCCIEFQSITDEADINSERCYDIEECEYITDTGNIVECELFEK